MSQVRDFFARISKSALSRAGVGVTSRRNLVDLMAFHADVNSLLARPIEDLEMAASLLGKSKSQMKQDLFVLMELGFKSCGYFVEFGATNGVDLSNSYLLETKFGWRGIVAEPARCWHAALERNRTCHIDTRCVWTETGSTVEFNEAETAELSTINVFSASDARSAGRVAGAKYRVGTVSLNDLLATYGAPQQIDYLSIDTEGSEFDILNSFDFRQHEFRVITCEHNYTPMREAIFELLSRQGYSRKYVGLSKWDDWYVK